MLAVVEQQQHPAVAAERAQGVARGAGRGEGQPERRGHGGDDLLGGARPGEVDAPHAVRERTRRRPGRVEREPGLAAPGGPDDGDEPVGRDERLHPVALGVAPDQPHRPGREVDLGRRALPARGRDGRRGVARQDLRLQRAQLAARLDAELGAEEAAGLLVGRERAVGAPGAVVGEHALDPQPLAQRVVGDGRGQLDERPLGVADREQGRDVPLPHLRPELLEPRHGRAGPRLVGDGRERPTPPQLQRLFAAPQGPFGLAVGQQSQGVVGQHGEPQRVDLLGRGDEPVAPRFAQQHGGGRAAGAAGLEHVAQPPHVRVEGGGRAGARVLAPHGGGEGIGAHDVARLHEQQGERADQPAADQRDRFVGAVDDERPEIAEVQHPGACLRPGRGASRHPRPPPHRRPGLSAYVARGGPGHGRPGVKIGWGPRRRRGWGPGDRAPRCRRGSRSRR